MQKFNKKYGLICFLSVLCLFVLYDQSQPEYTANYDNDIYNCSLIPRKLSNHSRRLCDGEEMSFSSLKTSDAEIYGKPFECELIEYLRDFKLTKEYTNNEERVKIDPDDIVVVTYASSNHYKELMNGLRNIRNMTNYKIIFYDLGLKSRQVKALRKLDNLYYKKFKFEAYPPHVKKLTKYAFKPIIVADAYLHYKTFWVFDASCRFIDNEKLKMFYKGVNNGIYEPYSILAPASHSIYAATNIGMYEYLPIPCGAAQREMHAATMQFVSRSKFSKEVIKWYLLCALNLSCISPAGCTLWCKFGEERYKAHAKCHRFDQSALSIIHGRTMQKFGLSARSNRTAFEGFIFVDRAAP